MRCLSRVLLLAAGWASSMQSAPVLSLISSSVPAATGNPVTLALEISGLDSSIPQNVGSFDLFMGFNPALLTPAGAVFSPYLGDAAVSEALTDFTTPSASVVEVTEVSLLSGPDLAALQPPGFTLATITFSRRAQGLAIFEDRGGPVDDQDGKLISGTKTQIPEPATGLVVAAVLTIVWMGQRLWRKPSLGKRGDLN